MFDNFDLANFFLDPCSGLVSRSWGSVSREFHLDVPRATAEEGQSRCSEERPRDGVQVAAA